jgi:prepilin-type N-terminal cleavage/methylation domain-containing protein
MQRGHLHMLSKLKKANHEGFTIIEVLIVLAIAGLILLIVFLAVPALQRNARNTDRKNDASALAAAVSEYEDNNSGATPAVLIGSNGTFNVCASNPCGASESPAQVKLGYYTTSGTGTGDATVVTSLTYLAANTDTLYAEIGVTCNGNNPTTTGASSRSLALVYYVETGSGFSKQCTAS